MSFSADTDCKCTVLPAVNFGVRADHLKIDMLLLHYTGMETGAAAIDWLCCAESGVSCHYVVEEDGAVLQLVPETKRAWHAGASCWQGETDTNSRSIGIEIVNPGHEYGYPDFPDVQVSAVIDLCRDVLNRHSIPNPNVLAHSDVAPGRKQDPGEKFPWANLYEAGIGLWVPEVSDSGTNLTDNSSYDEVRDFQLELQSVGYCLEPSGNYDQPTQNCVSAFQMHFRQSKVDGVADAGTRKTLKRLVNLLASH